MSKSVNQKASAVILSVALPVKLEAIAAQVAGAMQETASLSETLGSLTRQAGLLITKQPEMIDPFVDACRQLCAVVGLTEGSFKVYMSNIRGVIRAMVDGYKPKDGQSLRAMYDAAPKGTGRQSVAPKTGARHTAAASSDDVESASTPVVPVPTAAASDAERRHAAMIVLFGHADDELDACLAWARNHELRFTALVKSQIVFDSKPVGKVVKSSTVLGLGKRADGTVGIKQMAA